MAAGAQLGTELAQAAETDDPKKLRPQPGDRLLFRSGERKGEFVRVEDLPIGGPQTLVLPVDPASEVVRNGSKLNQVIVIRLDPAELSERTAEHAAEGVVAYSAICSHQACPVSMFKEAKGTLFCACHGSEYDPKDAATVVAGPSKRRLAMLPLGVEDGVLVVAGEFTGKVGAEKR